MTPSCTTRSCEAPRWAPQGSAFLCATGNRWKTGSAEGKWKGQETGSGRNKPQNSLPKLQLVLRYGRILEIIIACHRQSSMESKQRDWRITFEIRGVSTCSMPCCFHALKRLMAAAVPSSSIYSIVASYYIEFRRRGSKNKPAHQSWLGGRTPDTTTHQSYAVKAMQPHPSLAGDAAPGWLPSHSSPYKHHSLRDKVKLSAEFREPQRRS
eukprot:scaffold40_cov305-Pinguiococcus_pyrenoidosus.AAC.15